MRTPAEQGQEKHLREEDLEDVTVIDVDGKKTCDIHESMLFPEIKRQIVQEVGLVDAAKRQILPFGGDVG